MTEPTRCKDCGVLDALGRHGPTCPYALKIGLPRLAEGEEPIEREEVLDTARGMGLTEDDVDMDDPNIESGYDGPVAEGGEVSPNHPAHPQWHEHPQRMIRAEATSRMIPPPVLPELWFAYADVDTPGFDAIVFGSEIDALRYAVTHGWHVKPLDLGESLHGQARSEAPRASLPHDER